MADLKTARVKKNLSQAELSGQINISEVQISRYEQGHSFPHPGTRRRIEEVLGPIDWADAGTALTTYEQRKMFSALQMAAERLGNFKDAIDMFANKSPDEIRKLIAFVRGTEEDEDALPTLPPPEVERNSKKGKDK